MIQSPSPFTDQYTSIDPTELLKLKRITHVGPYTRLTLRWKANLEVGENTAGSSYRRKCYNASVVLNNVTLAVTLVQESLHYRQDLSGRVNLEGVVVQGGIDRSSRLVLDALDDTACADRRRSFAAETTVGLQVAGSALLVKDSFVRNDSAGSKWRVAVMMHREWDMQYLMYREFEVDYIYDRLAIGAASIGHLRPGEVVSVSGNVVDIGGAHGKWIVALHH
ncbi:uncharacterized protein MELLADRAFT_60406 [Melampsora larici-populina 98AG31]|uniref:Uncharacterized protein n=1 Tax=Melampsora larici-populina (strain 98AG31 / pathotype 3-4-7) TaxID=747676 RepID=F4RA01_MELLP|nr:uncharacterized protein MELLADRAFT_60406 [Melampsora larici-populina 98AG31]EGG10656.1 hypothetical protein MELLADRAFT_60406 [Melampsora larici-populina 98AG31]